MRLTNHLDANSNRVVNLADPTSNQDAATKAYVDAIAQGFRWKEPAKAATTANITLSGAQTIDGVSIVAGDRVLVKNQTTGASNGIYLAGAGAWTRAVDFDANSEVEDASVFVSQGATQGNSTWQLTTDGPITLDTTALAFSQIGGGTAYTSGTGINISGSTISVDTTVVARKAVATIGDGSATVYTINHALNNADVAVQVYESGATGEQVLADVKKVDVNNVSVTFATAPAVGSYKVVVVG